VNQQGYSLLLSMVILLGASTVWIAGMTMGVVTYTADQTLALSQARDALMNYAVNYIDHYGPQGAGVGHFPCPDTDIPNASHEDSWHRDGPNPPCAKQIVEQGWLPRHVDVRGGRFQFHTRPQQRLLYAVSGKFVNNPVNRIVNPSTVSEFSIGQYSDVVAILATPPLDAGLQDNTNWFSPEQLNTQGQAYTLIRESDIRLLLMKRVGGWMASRLNIALAQRCANLQLGICAAGEHVIAPCVFDKKFVFLHWLDTASVPIFCETHEQYLATKFALFEEVPIDRHWFMRNKWFEFVSIDADKACTGVAESPCQFVLEAVNGSPTGDGPSLTIQLRPI